MKRPNNKDTPSPMDESAHKKTLSPVLGISPLVYIPILYGLVCIALIVFLLWRIVFVNKGEYMYVDSTPEQAAIIINDIYKGVTPKKVKILPGSYELEVSLPYYTSYKEAGVAKNKIFLRPFRSNKKYALLMPLEPDMETQRSYNAMLYKIPDTLIAYTVEELASWNTTDPHSKRQIHPHILDQQMNNLAQSLASVPANDSSMRNRILSLQQEILYESMPYVILSGKTQNYSQEEQWLFHYKALISLPEYQSFVQKYQLEDNFVYKNTMLDNFYHQLISEETTNWQIPPLDSVPYPSFSSNAPRSIRQFNLNFSLVSAKEIFLEQNLSTNTDINTKILQYMEYSDKKLLEKTSKDVISYLEVRVPSFYVMNREITQSDFALFLREHNTDIAQWKQDTQAWVSPDHQEMHFFDYNPSQFPSRPLRYITWYDAMSYSTWLDNKMRPLGYHAQLPNEYEWRSASIDYDTIAELDQDPNFIPPPQSRTKVILWGSLWEWGASWYSIAPQYAGFDGPLYGSERHILGGSYITQSQPLGTIHKPAYASRNAALLPSWVSPYVGFRVILTALEPSSK